MNTRTRSTRLAIVGAGPRAIGVLERLAAHMSGPAEERAADLPLQIDLIDPHMPGSGRIWRADESPLLLMNSRAADVTIFTDETSTSEGPVVAGPSLAQWAAGVRSGEIAAPTAGTRRRREIEQVTPTSFVSRRVQALYLEWFFAQVVAALPRTVEVTVHRTTVTSLEEPVSGGPWRLHLEDRAGLASDLVLLAAGHTDARPDEERHDLASFASRHGGAYVAPAQATDADLDALGPGRTVIVRGMGLAFIDLMALLTEGRGGRFVPDPVTGMPDRLRYLPSGQEPTLWVGSRRGVPYHSKVTDESVPTGPSDLVHVTEQNLRTREDADGRVDFQVDVLPLIAAEIERAVPDAPRPGPGEEPLDWLDAPLAWLDGDADATVTRDAVVRHVEHDLRSRTGTDVDSARALFQVLLRLHGALSDLLPATRLRGVGGDVPRWWHSLFSFVASGPPPHRLHQLLALERAGVVGFVGPRITVRTDDATGRFVARGGAGVRIGADALIDAFLPAQTLTTSANPLLRDLVSDQGDRGQIGRESAVAPGKLETDLDQRVVEPGGTAHRTLWAVGPWTSEMPIGAFARPCTDAPCFRRNDVLARDLLRAARDGAAPRDDITVPRHDDPGSPTMGARVLRPRRLGILGLGKLGTALARTALRSGLEVVVASRAPAADVRRTTPGVTVVETAQLGAAADIVVLAVPLHAALSLDPGWLRPAVVVDATNGWSAEDADALVEARRSLAAARAGRPPDPGATAEPSTSELLAAHLAEASVVKTLNHIGYHDLEDDGRPPGAPDRRAFAIAADDDRAAEAVSTVLGRMGFDAVHIGPLADGRHLEPGGRLFHGRSSQYELSRAGQELARVA